MVYIKLHNHIFWLKSSKCCVLIKQLFLERRITSKICCCFKKPNFQLYGIVSTIIWRKNNRKSFFLLKRHLNFRKCIHIAFYIKTKLFFTLSIPLMTLLKSAGIISNVSILYNVKMFYFQHNPTSSSKCNWAESVPPIFD